MRMNKVVSVDVKISISFEIGEEEDVKKAIEQVMNAAEFKDTELAENVDFGSYEEVAEDDIRITDWVENPTEEELEEIMRDWKDEQEALEREYWHSVF